MHEAPQHPHKVALQTFVDVDGAAIPTPAPRFWRSDNAVPPPQAEGPDVTVVVLQSAGFSAGEIEAPR